MSLRKKLSELNRRRKERRRATSAPAATALIDQELEAACSLPLSDVQRQTRTYKDLMIEVARATGATLIPTEDLNCDELTQRCAVRAEGQLRYSYGDHYSDHGAFPVAQRIHRTLGAAPTRHFMQQPATTTVIKP